MAEQESIVRWLWERGVGRFILALLVLGIALASIFIVDEVPEWLQGLAVAVVAFYFGAATTSGRDRSVTRAGNEGAQS